MDVNPYKAPEYYAERPKRPWVPTSRATKIGAGVIGVAGLGQLSEGSRLGDMWRIGSGLVLLTVAATLWVAGDQPFFRSA
jgi:hypothetical protein